MREECLKCFEKTTTHLIAKYHHEIENVAVLKESLDQTINQFQNLPVVELSAKVHRMVQEQTQATDLYAREKAQANSLLLGQYDYWANHIQLSNDSWYTAAKLAVVGNVIDYGAHVLEDDISEQIQTLVKQHITKDETDSLFEAIRKAKKILYLGDNTGEIVFDKLFIETIGHPQIIYAVRGAPILNDVTLQDAEQVGINSICKVISNGNGAPSTILEQCSEEFLEYFHSADLVISKGQGNFEGLMNISHPNLYFMLMAKCNPIAEMLGVNARDLVVTKLKN